MNFIVEHLGELLTIISIILSILYIRSQIVLGRQNKDIEDMKSDAKHRDAQLELVRKMAEDMSRRDIVHSEANSKREEAWQQTLKDFSTEFKASFRELVDEFKTQRKEISASIENSATANRNLSDVLEVQIMRVNVLESEVRATQKLAANTLTTSISLSNQTNDNIDHAILVIEAIRDRIIKVTEDLSIEPILKKLDEIYEILPKKEPANEPPPISNLLPVNSVLPDSVSTGTSPGADHPGPAAERPDTGSGD